MFSHKNAAISAWLSLMIGIKSVSCKPPLRHGLSGTISGLYYNGFRPYNQAISKKIRNCFPMRLTFALSCVYDNSHRNANFSFLCVTPAGFRKYFIK